MVISIKNVTKSIKNNRVLKSISVELQSGRIYGIKGKNGSGKTMLLKAISGLITIDEGEIFINSQRLGSDIDFPESLGLLIENTGFPGGLNAFDNLRVIASIKNCISENDINETICRVGLKSDANKKYRQYSLGMKQKLAIAAAIMEKPKILLLDEPTNGLDDESINTLMTILQEEKARGALIVIVSHDLEELGRISDKMFLMKDGCLEKI